ncbi:MAG: DUF6502 family protein [Granulosicoccus sp.]
MTTQAVMLKAIYRILKPLAKVALYYGVSAGTATELLRRAFVDAAEESLKEQGVKALTARLCVLTGFYRKEVVRIKNMPAIGDDSVDERYNRSSRVISAWHRDPDFTTKAGKPAVLKLEGEFGFNELIRRYSGDMRPRSMLEELIRLQVVEISSRNTVKLKTRAYIAQSSEIDGLQVLGKDTADLINTIFHNIHAEPTSKRFQRKVNYVHIPERHVNDFQAHAAKESQLLLEKLDRWLAARDTENKSLGTSGSQLGLGIYLSVSQNETQNDSQEITPDRIRGCD